MEKNEKQLIDLFLKGVDQFLIGKSPLDFGVERNDFRNDCIAVFLEKLKQGEEFENVPGYGWGVAKNIWKKLLEGKGMLDIPLDEEIEEVSEIDVRKREEGNFYDQLKYKAITEAITQHQELFSSEYTYSGIFEWLRRHPPVKGVKKNGKLEINVQSLLLRLLWHHLGNSDQFRSVVAIFEGQSIQFPAHEQLVEAVQQAELFDKKENEKQREDYYDDGKSEKFYKLNKRTDLELAVEVLGAERVLAEESGKEISEQTEKALLNRMNYLLKKENQYRSQLKDLDKLEKSFRDKKEWEKHPPGWQAKQRKLFYRKTGITVLASQFFRRLDLLRKQARLK